MGREEVRNGRQGLVIGAKVEGVTSFACRVGDAREGF
jgi:hypothetical protein